MDNQELIVAHLAPYLKHCRPIWGRKPRLYLIRAMSGRPDSEVVQEAERDKAFFEACGFEVFCPVNAEQVKATGTKIDTPLTKMIDYWFRKDKPGIRWADVVLHMTPLILSFGGIHEVILSRGTYWKPTVWVFPEGKVPGPGNVVNIEGDFVTDNYFEAAAEIYDRWGSPLRRLGWRLSLLNRKFLRFVQHQIQFLIQTW